MSKICIIDYKTGGNIFSVENSLRRVGAQTLITSEPQLILSADKIVFPGVGSFDIAKQQIDNLGISQALIQARKAQIPILGICVGMQLMFEYGTEGIGSAGLGFFEGTVDKFQTDEQNKLKIPHMGWNTVNFPNPSANPLSKGLSAQESFYFVHSYRVAKPEVVNPKLEIAYTDYAGPFISQIWDRELSWGYQFHLEKSAELGLRVLKNFVDL